MHNVRKLVNNLMLKGLLRPMESEVLEEEIAEAERLAKIGRATENKEKPAETISVDEEVFCTNCCSCLVGRWSNEDDDYNIFYNYCPECGQAISQHIEEQEVRHD